MSAVVVDPDPLGRAELVLLVAEASGGAVLGLASAAELRAVARREPPGLVVFALRGQGAAVAAARVEALRRQCDRALVYLLVEPGVEIDVADPRLHVGRLGGPFEGLRWLAAHVEGRVAAATVPLPDLLQVGCEGGHTVRVLGVRDGRRIGEVDVVQGELWAARDRQGSGPEALQRLVAPGVVGTCRPVPEPLPARNVDGHCMHVMLEAARRLDEARAASTAAP